MLFERVFLFQAVVSILPFVLNYSQLRQREIQSGNPSVMPGIEIAVSILVDFFLWYFIARRASVSAKWIMVVMSVLALAALPSEYAEGREIGLAYSVPSALGYLGWFAALAFLFRADARLWLGSRGAVAPVDPAIFD